MGGEAHVPWDRQEWNKSKALVKEIQDDYELSNPEIQRKILQILEQKAENG